MNRTIKEATVKRFHYDDHNQLRRHLADFVSAYNFARRLKTLKGLTLGEFGYQPAQGEIRLPAPLHQPIAVRPRNLLRPISPVARATLTPTAKVRSLEKPKYKGEKP
jgi:hypothetical protein